MITRTTAVACLMLLAAPLFAAARFDLDIADDQHITGEQHTLRAQVVVKHLEHPWSVAFLPGGGYLITERPGRLNRITPDGRRIVLRNLPDITARGQGGLLDVVLHPAFSDNRLIYFSYVRGAGRRLGTAVARARLAGDALRDVEPLFHMQPQSDSGHHFGSRLVFDRNGLLFITLGDRGDRHRAQRLNDHAGAIVRLHDDGRIPHDNPLVGQPGVRPEIWSWGHRNPQGAALNPWTGQLWTHEHGPQGGDEVNIARAGANYGWPVITYGVNYGSGTPIGVGTHRPGMVQPLHHWTPSIAPSGMAFYDRTRFAGWHGDLLIGSLKFRQLVRLTLDGNRVVHEERLLSDRFGRIRDVRVHPDGAVYLLTDARAGALIRLTPMP